MRQSSPAKPRRAAGSDAVSAVRRRMMRTGLVLVLVFAIVDGVFGERGLLANMDVRHRIAVQQVAIDEMTARNNGLTEDIRRLREDPSAVEELAREELGLMKDGELLIILRDMPSSAAQPSKGGAPSR
ncbi:cell division protein FtsB [Luteitalea pratensis]|uniref:Cell division protein FtsB n=1 Tax=Luteitalea pratensis TaxID=1855912 RepID=A0A143PQC8_LUTPR|nr:septum formation initiator family protein [Luteitalea pratensis]AMY10822.1 cell division protein FtsB [Luteitalea pratensis]